MGVESDAEKKLRYLCSSEAERLSDYQRINHFITASSAVLAEIRMIREALKQYRSIEAGRLGEPHGHE